MNSDFTNWEDFNIVDIDLDSDVANLDNSEVKNNSVDIKFNKDFNINSKDFTKNSEVADINSKVDIKNNEVTIKKDSIIDGETGFIAFDGVNYHISKPDLRNIIDKVYTGNSIFLCLQCKRISFMPIGSRGTLCNECIKKTKGRPAGSKNVTVTRKMKRKAKRRR